MVFRLPGNALLLQRVYHGPAARSSTPKDGNFADVAILRRGLQCPSLPTARRRGDPILCGTYRAAAGSAACELVTAYVVSGIDMTQLGDRYDLSCLGTTLPDVRQLQTTGGE